MTVVDLFSGCGGLSRGFLDAGFEIGASFDNWEEAIAVYKENFSHPAIVLDLSDVDRAVEEISNFNPSMIIGGPPCQDFSSAGKRDETLGRGDLTLSYANIINLIRPKYFLMENVERITKTNILRNAIEIYKNAGYGLTAKVLDASFCGVPQARKRFFLIGCLDEEDDFLLPYLERSLSQKAMTVFDYLGDSLGLEYYYRHPRSYQRRGVFSVHEPSPTIRGVNRPIPKGYTKHSGDLVDVNDYPKLRALTTTERSYIQTFPPNFKFNGKKSDLEQIIGNAVPVKLAQYVATCLNEYINDEVKIKTLEKSQLSLSFAV